MSGPLDKSHFWGITLDAKHKEEKWEGSAADSKTDQIVEVSHTLAVRQAIITPDCKEDEAQVVEMETLGYNKKKMKCPIFAGKGVCTVTTDLVVTDHPVTFRLVSGSGPVYICGTHAIEHAVHEDEDEDGLMGLDEEIEEEEEPLPEPPKKKSKA